MKHLTTTTYPVKDNHALSSEEATRLAELEPIIARGMATFVEVGTALLEISDRRLYRQTHSTFKDYVEEKWKMSVRQAYRLCESAEVIKSLPAKCDQLVTSESQARALAEVEPEKRPEVLEVVAGAGRVTAKAIRKAVSDRDILRAAKAIRGEVRSARCAKRMSVTVMPIALHPIDTTGRKMRVIVSPDHQQCCLVIGPNAAGVKLAPWWESYRQQAQYQKTLDAAKELEEEAERLRSRAAELRTSAAERARQEFIKEHGEPLHYAETLDVDYPASQLPKGAAAAADHLFEKIKSGELKIQKSGAWGDLNLPFPMQAQPVAPTLDGRRGWAGCGSAGWLAEFFPDSLAPQEAAA